MKTLKLISLCAAVLVARHSSASQWVSTGSMGVAHSGYGIVRLPDGRVLETSARAASNRELFTPATGQWTATGASNYERYRSDAIVLSNGSVLAVGDYFNSLAGGSSGLGGHSAEIWDPAVGTWRSTASLISERNYVGLAALPDGTILVPGGSLDTGSIQSAEIFHPATETWTPTGDMLRPHATVGALVTLLDGRAFVAASNSETYNYQTGSWSASGDMLSPRTYPYTTTLLPDGRVMVTGGDASYRGVEIFDPTTETWTATASLPTERWDHRAALLPDGRVLVAGGANRPSMDTFLNSTDIYDPATNTWSPGPNMNQQRADFLIVALDTGILVAGGLVGITCTTDCFQDYTNFAEIFYP